LFVVKHVGYKYLNYHFGVGFIAPLWDNSLKSTLLLTPPFSAYKKLSNKFLKIIKHNHPKRLSRYLLGLSWDKEKKEYKRKRPPWRNIAGHVLWTIKNTNKLIAKHKAKHKI
jgi:hypothetical protein